MSGDQWTGSKDSPNFMTLTFNSKFVQDRPAKKGFRLRFNAIEKNGNSYPLSLCSNELLAVSYFCDGKLVLLAAGKCFFQVTYC